MHITSVTQLELISWDSIKSSHQKMILSRHYSFFYFSCASLKACFSQYHCCCHIWIRRIISASSSHSSSYCLYPKMHSLFFCQLISSVGPLFFLFVRFGWCYSKCWTKCSLFPNSKTMSEWKNLLEIILIKYIFIIIFKIYEVKHQAEQIQTNVMNKKQNTTAQLTWTFNPISPFVYKREINHSCLEMSSYRMWNIHNTGKCHQGIQK